MSDTKRKIMRRVEAKSGKATTTKEHKGKIVSEEQEEVPGASSDKPLCSVTFGGGFTRQIVQYEPVKVSVSVTIPCELEDLEGTYTKAKQFVEDKLQESYEELN